MSVPIENIRNFCIIAHIDHGKSTLADRILEITGTVSKRQLREQTLDSIDIERERGITIKAKAVRLSYKNYELNLIDTPGHVDFSYEVSHSLAACEGAILVVDATQGVQAQTIANANLAIEQGLEIIPVVNKIDLSNARPDEVIKEMKNSIGVSEEEVLLISAKNGTGVPRLIDELIRRTPFPKGNPKSPLQILVFDSHYDDYKGVITYIRLVNGTLKKGDSIRFLSNGKECKVEDIGIFRLSMQPIEKLAAGEVGYLTANIKSISDIKIGDTIVEASDVNTKPLPGYKDSVPVVFCGLYPVNETSFDDLKKALEKLSLNDASFRFHKETSEALGYGFRCGFLGLLHMEIVQERIKREFGIDVIQTCPTVTYEIVNNVGGKKEIIKIDNPNKIKDEQFIVEWREPMVRMTLIIPADSIGPMMKLCEYKRGRYIKTEYISPTRVILSYDIPFAEIMYDFYDKLKSITRGYGTLDYVFAGYEASDLVKLRIMVANKEVDAFSTIVHRDFAESRGRKIIQILRKEIPRHLFQIALQASVGKRIIAREDIKPLAKNVTGKCYGGDITRKRKLWEKQKLGKKKLKSIGMVDIPQEVFMAVLNARQEEEN